jgi:transcriptional regulator with XRE-family HTH domain
LSPQQRFAVNLRRARIRSGLSQAEVGRRCRLHRTEVSLLERAGREPRLGTLVKLAAVLGTTPEALCAGISWLPAAGSFEAEPPGGGREAGLGS